MPRHRSQPRSGVVADRARAHPTRFLLALGLLTTSTSVVSSLGAPLVPTVAASFDVSLASAQWVLTAPFLVGTVATPVVGRLGAGRWRRPVVLGGLVLVFLGLGMGALPLSLGFLLAGRGLCGVGIALAALALASAREHLPADRVRGGLAMLSVSTVVGSGIGYPVTSLVAQWGGLRAAFGFGLVVTALTLVACIRLLPTSESAKAEPVDWAGAALLGAGTLVILLVVSQGHHWGWTSPSVGVMAVLGLLAVGLWVHRTRGHDHPLVDLRLAVRGSVLTANLVALLAGIAVYMLVGLVMVQVQEPTTSGFGLGRSIGVAGLLLTPYAIATVVGSRIATRAMHRWPLDLLLPVGLVSYLLATLLYAWRHDSVGAVAVVMALGGLGSGLSFASMPGLVVRETPMTETSSALGFNLLLRYLGFSLGSALAITCLDVLSDGSPDADGFVRTLLVCAGVWIAALVTALGLELRRGRTARRDRVPPHPAEIVLPIESP